MILFIVVIILGLLAWLIFQPDWMPKPPKNEFFQAVSQQAGRLRQRFNQWIKKESSLGRQLKAWALQQDLAIKAGFSQAQTEQLAELQMWLQSISDKQADSLAQELSSFCAKQGVDLRWLLEDNGNVNLQATLSNLVLFFGLAVRERCHSRPNAALRAWEEAPLMKKNRKFGNLLYISLVDAKLIIIPSHLLLAPQKERLAHLVSSIKSVIVKDRDAVIPYAAQALEVNPTPEPGRAPSSAQPATSPEV